jgi:DNA (cytosine-5)-methyltransferase 1
MKFGSVCSGIEAASVAWHPLGWTAAWLAEIEPFPSAVLAHHYPDVPNLGDMTKLPERIRSGEIEAPDIFCGGTPCQAFSVAGLRKSLDDARGNLSLIFCEIANEIDSVRSVRGEQPAIVFWENVPGVLNTKDNAFGCFLAGLAGEDDPLVPPGDKWTNAGCVYGPKRAVAWRVLDAQYFGVAQRRRRVFVVASARTGLDPAAILFEFDGVRRDIAPSRQAGEGTAAGTLRCTDGGSDVDHARAGHVQPVVGTLTASFGRLLGASGQDADHGHSHLVRCITGDITHTLKAEGFDASEDGTGRGTPMVPFHGIDLSYQRQLLGEADNDYWQRMADYEHKHGITPEMLAGGSRPWPAPIAYATKLHNTTSNQAGKFYENYTASLDANSPPPAIVFDTTQITSPLNFSNPQPGDPCHPLAAQAHVPAVAFNWQAGGTQTTLGYDPEAGTSGTLIKDQVQAVAFQPGNLARGAGSSPSTEVFPTLKSDHGRGASDQDPHVLTAMQVRRLTPVECEALQGFPPGYTMIPWRKKPADLCPDGPRYKALGNSWAVPNVAWIGRRIAAALEKTASQAVSE